MDAGQDERSEKTSYLHPSHPRVGRFAISVIHFARTRLLPERGLGWNQMPNTSKVPFSAFPRGRQKGEIHDLPTARDV
jgi:hypothetical protein